MPAHNSREDKIAGRGKIEKPGDWCTAGILLYESALVRSILS